MSNAPGILDERQSFADRDDLAQGDAASSDRHDRDTGVRSAQPGDADVKPGEQGQFGNLSQNLTTHWQVQQR